MNPEATGIDNVEAKQLLYELFHGEDFVEASKTGESFKIGDRTFDAEKVRELVKKKAVGIVKRTLERDDKAFLIYHNFDGRFGRISSHSLAPELYFELMYVAKHREEDIEGLMESVISIYEELFPLNKSIKCGTRLARAIALTCRGKYMCPTNMRKYFKIGGGAAKIQADGEAIGQELGYNPRRLLKSWILKAQREFGVGEEFDRDVMKLLRNDNDNQLSNSSYMAALFYLALTTEGSKVGDQITHDDVAGFFDITDQILRVSVQGYCDRNNFPYRSHAKPPEVYAFMEEFNTSLGYRPNIGKPKPGSRSLKEYEELRRVVEFLLKNKHFADNPISEDELTKQLFPLDTGFEESYKHFKIINRSVSPVKYKLQSSADTSFRWKGASYYVNLDEERSKAWLATMDKFISYANSQL